VRGVLPDLAAAASAIEARGGTLGRPLHLLRVTGSTNDEALRAAREGAPHGATWVTEEQTQGRGRRGRSWVSPPGEGLLFSVLVRLACPPARLPSLALVAGLAVRDAVAAAAPDASPRIKWPNDVVVGARKVAGILVESITSGSKVEALVIGVGINVHTREFPEDIRERATSIALVASGPPDRGALLADVLASLDRDLHVVASRGLGLLRARLEAADTLRGRRIRSDAGAEGTGAGIDDEGRLLVRRDDGGIARWIAGEVSLLRD
jgi:BirA family biotin operon repressor/biotin-[acetyl-CoA-carboxylase] ligase